MSFKRFILSIRVMEASVYLTVFFLLLFVVLPYIDMPIAADIFFSFVGALGAFALLVKYKSQLIWQNVLHRSVMFYKTLETSHIEGIREYYLRGLKFSYNPVVKGHNLFMSYAMHEYISDEAYPFIHDISEFEQAYNDFFYYQVIQVREIMMFRLIQNGQIEAANEMCKKQLDYIERMIDEQQVPLDLEESILNLSSTYRQLIRFIGSPNVRTAFAIKVPENAANFDKVRTLYSITRIFIENEMNDQAKVAIEKTDEISGNYRLLERLRKYKEEL